MLAAQDASSASPLRAWSAVLTAGALPEVVVSAVASIPIMLVIGREGGHVLGQVAQELEPTGKAAAEIACQQGDTMSRFTDMLKAPAASGRTGPATRQGRKHVGVYVPPDVAHRLRVLAAVESTSTQALIEQAIEMLFQSRRSG